MEEGVFGEESERLGLWDEETPAAADPASESMGGDRSALAEAAAATAAATA